MIKKVTAALSESVDRWTDIGLLRMSLIAAVMALTMASCDKSCVCHYNDSLSDRMAPVKVNVLWDERFQETPSGVTILAYASNGCLYNSFKSNRTDYVEMFLPEGEFTLVAINQSINELLPIWFDGFEKFNSTRITLSPMDIPPSFMDEGSTSGSGNSDGGNNGNNGNGGNYGNNSNNIDEGGNHDNTSDTGVTGSDDSQTTPKDSSPSGTGTTSIAQTLTETLVQPSPWLALSTPVTVTIAQEELMNINTHCKCKVCCCSHLHDATTATHFLEIRMVPQTYTISVNLSVQNLTSIASIKAYIKSLTPSINLYGEQLREKASILLEQWQKKMTTETEGVISSKTSCLSMGITDESALVIEFTLLDGKTTVLETIPLKDNVRIDHQKLTVTADLVLEKPLPTVEGEPAGAFWVTVTDWGEATDIDI